MRLDFSLGGLRREHHGRRITARHTQRIGRPGQRARNGRRQDLRYDLRGPQVRTDFEPFRQADDRTRAGQAGELTGSRRDSRLPVAGKR